MSDRGDLLPLDGGFIFTDASDPALHPLAQMFRMYNERMLAVSAKMQIWNQNGLTDVFIEDLFPVGLYEGNEGHSFESGLRYRFQLEQPIPPGYATTQLRPIANEDVQYKTIDDAVITNGADFQNWRAWRHIQQNIEEVISGPYVIPLPNTEIGVGRSRGPENYRRFRNAQMQERGYIQPGDIIGPWLIEDITSRLSEMLIVSRNSLRAQALFNEYSNTGPEVIKRQPALNAYFGWRRVDNLIIGVYEDLFNSLYGFADSSSGRFFQEGEWLFPRTKATLEFVPPHGVFGFKSKGTFEYVVVQQGGPRTTCSASGFSQGSGTQSERFFKREEVGEWGTYTDVGPPNAFFAPQNPTVEPLDPVSNPGTTISTGVRSFILQPHFSIKGINADYDILSSQ